MKTVKRIHMEGFSGQTVEEFADGFNSIMNLVAKGERLIEYKTDLATLRGFATLEETIRIPETYKDRFDLVGVRINCWQCKHFTPSKYNCGTCAHCRGELRRNDEVCDRFFHEWESGNCWLADGEEEKYVHVINES